LKDGHGSERRLAKLLSKDTWTWELVRGLKLAMDDFDIDLVRCMREPKEIKTITSNNIMSFRYFQILNITGPGHPHQAKA
jgi:hypothetical protein